LTPYRRAKKGSVCISALRGFASLRLGVKSVLVEQEKKSELRIARIHADDTEDKEDHTKTRRHNPKANKIFLFVALVALCENPKRG
jgi:hypothetical protein